MTDQTGRPDDENRPDGTTPPPDQPRGRDEAAEESVLTGFSWDDPSGARRPEDDPRSGPTDRPATDDGTSPSPSNGSSVADGAGSYGGSPSYGSVPEAPAQYPPAAPYPPAGDPYGQAPSPQSGQPYGQQYGQQQGEPYGRPSSPYGQAPAPYPTQSGGYGPSAEYTSTPQPYSYGPPPLSPEAEKARSGAILWTILNGVAIFLCGNLLAIGGVICAAIAIGKAREDVQASRNLTKWSWILFAVGFALWVLLIIGFFALGLAGAFGTATTMNEF